MSKEAFEVESKFEAFFTGGNIVWSADGENLFCQNGSKISILSVTKGAVITELGKPESEDESDDIVNTFAVDSSNHTLVTHHASSLFKLWDWKEGKILKLWKSIHNGPVSRIELRNGQFMASGGTDGSLRLWDLERNACTHSLKGLQGVVSILSCHPNPKMKLIFASGMENVIHGWNYTDGSHKCKLSGHYSEVTDLSFHDDGVHMVSSGRDKIMILWDIKKSTAIRTIPTFEGFESIFIVPSDAALPINLEGRNILVAAAGEKGVLKIYNANTGTIVYEQTNSLVLPAKEEGGLSITHLIYNRQFNEFAMVSTDHNIIIHSLKTFECKKQLVGYSDEILDVAFLGDSDSFLAVATNSHDIKLFEVSTMNCQLLCGHKNIVLALATTNANRNIMVSSDKDCSVRLWLLDPKTSTMSCIGVGTRHIAGVGSLAISQMLLKFFVSVSQDGTLNMWEMPENLENEEPKALKVSNSVRAHDKDINNVTISPNDKLIATASQDKTAKLWSADNLKLLGVLKDHRRGVWCVRFSPIDQVLLTSSADCTIKLWSLTELNCLKTLQGHESSVLKAEFVSRGTQLITSGGDGLLKLWSIKTSECITTLDEHNDKVWALAVNKMETHVVTGGRNSLLIIWRDVTEEKKQKAIQEQEEQVLQEQKLANLLQSQQLTAALTLALKLNKPFQVLKIVQGIISRGNNELSSTIKELKPARQEELLKCAAVWNMNSKNAEPAQLVINTLLNIFDIDHLRQMGLTSHLEALLPYTDRHFKRLTRLLQDVHLLKYTVSQMNSHSVPESISTLSLDDEMIS